ncbi:MAG: ankyrin repeat domain-containing protein, partial [Spirochaetes bacterium]|nr:ankyrin repeat domain-containing protein [Spirochaetota bacterium]
MKKLLILVFIFAFTFLSVAASRDEIKLSDAIEKGDVKKVEKYLSKGVDPNSSYHRYQGAYRQFNLAVDKLLENKSKESSYFQILELFCKYKVNLDGPEFPPLVTAVEQNHMKLIKFLLDKGANPNVGQYSNMENKTFFPFDL